LTTLGAVFSFLVLDLDGQRRDVDGRIFERTQGGADGFGIDCGKVALDIDDDFGAAFGIGGLQCLVDAVRAGLMVGARHDDFEAGIGHSGIGILMVDGDDDATDRRLARALGNLYDHGQAANIGERLARQARGGHAGGNEDQRLV
jgi:hypothetical protein